MNQTHKFRSQLLVYHKLAIAVVVSVLLLPVTLPAQETVDYFKQNCISCHTIGGGRLTGPDLKNVSERQDRDWLVNFLLDPKGVIDSGDPYAQKLLSESRGVVMPTIALMTKERAGYLLDLIEEESTLEQSQFKGIQVSNRPFTSADVAKGHRLFLGDSELENGGAACISCHSVNGIAGLGGGTLAPDLTTVFERYEGRKTLSTWLSAPATPTMQATFKGHPLTPDEVLAFTAYFQHTLRRNPADPSTARLNFLLIGIGAAILILGVFDVLWNKRFRGVRKAMVEQSKRQGIVASAQQYNQHSEARDAENTRRTR